MNVSFQSSNINFNVISDTHGNIDKVANFVGQLSDLKDDVFQKEEKGNANVMCVVGDWFMSGGSVGYLSDKKRPFSFFQLDMFNAMKHATDDLAHNVATIFVPGNHEFDGGDKLLAKTLENIDADVLSTNMVLDKSRSFKKLVDSGKLVNSKVIEVEDDKQQGLYHKILLLGISPVNMSYYDRKSKGVTFVDNPQIAQKLVTPEDYEKTTQKCLEEIDKFKAENPNGAVILLSHSGVHFAQNLVKRSGKIDLVFDGHEHKNTQIKIDNTPIVSLGKDFQMFANSKLFFDDNGKFSIKQYRTYDIDKSDACVDKTTENFYETLLREDLKKKYCVKVPGNLSELSEQNIRFEDNQLANFITEKILKQINKHYSDVDVFALNASAMRNSIPVNQGASNMEVINVLKGITDDDADIVINEVTGAELANMVLNNILFNAVDKERNPLVHYAGLTINKTAIDAELAKGVPSPDISQFIRTDDGQILSANKKYKIANVKKFFEKSENFFEQELYKNSYLTELNAKHLFLDYFNENLGNLHYEPKTRWN